MLDDGQYRHEIVGDVHKDDSLAILPGAPAAAVWPSIAKEDVHVSVIDGVNELIVSGVGGSDGSGKLYVALAGWVVYDSTRFLLRRDGVAPPAPLFSSSGNPDSTTIRVSTGFRNRLWCDYFCGGPR